MNSIQFSAWCSSAVRKIRYLPDRRAVQQELYAHLEDHYEDLISQGVAPEEAQKRTLEAMGDPWKLADELARVHRPFWGFCLTATRWAIAGLLVLAVIFCGRMFYAHSGEFLPSDGERIVVPAACTPENPMTMLWESEPDAEAGCGGFTFRVPRAALWKAGENQILMLDLRQFHPVPWMGREEPVRLISAVDSLGNRYGSFYEGLNSRMDLFVHSRPVSGSPWRARYKITIWGVPEEAQWLELRYERDGRTMKLHLDLEGGDAV